MKFTLNWLKDFLETEASADDVALALNQVGLEVEKQIDKEKIFKPFIVGKITSSHKHPDADKLQVCTVNIGNKETQVVCGGKNAREGIKVVFAPIGSVIPENGMTMKPTKIRGIESHGMLLSSSELGLEDDIDGIIELPDIAVEGDCFAKYLGCDDVIFEVSITPNRGDCLGVYGIARDLAAKGLGKLKELKIGDVNSSFVSDISLKIETDQCQAYYARQIKNIDNLKENLLIKNRLKAIGVKTGSALADITNYITYSYARPVHVYDLSAVDDKEIKVRKSKPGEKFVSLNNQELTLSGGECVVSAGNKILSLAGIIGSDHSIVNESTKDVLIEIAIYCPKNVALTGRKYQINSEARHRFERNIDPCFLSDGEKIASQMVLENIGGIASDIIVAKNIEDYEPVIIDFNPKIISKKLGIEIDSRVYEQILEDLGFVFNYIDNEIKINVPSYRNDISIAEDIIEEVIRIYGYDKISPVKLPVDNLQVANISKGNRLSIETKRALVSRGFFEAITWSFTNEKYISFFSKIDESLKIKNPISSELNYLRPSIIPNLLQACLKNEQRSIKNIAIFEIGPIFDKSYDLNQTDVIAAVRYGKYASKNHYNTQRDYDVYDIKADIFAVLTELGFKNNNFIIDDVNTPLWGHPARSAAIKLGKNIIGYFGQIHPKCCNNFGIGKQAFAFEVFLENIPKVKSKFGRKISPDYSDYPAVNRDLAFILDKHIAASELISIIKNVDKKLVKEINIFDVFESDVIGENKKSIALTVSLQSVHKTLVEDEIENVFEKIISNIVSKLDGKLRDS